MKQLLFFSFCFFIAITIRGQSFEPQLIGVVNGAGYDADIQLDWSVGESFIQFQPTDFGALSEGFIQPMWLRRPLDTPTEITEPTVRMDDYQWIVSPNPVSNNLRLQLDRRNEWLCYVTILDYSGKMKLLKIFPVGDRQIDLDMSGFPSGIYLVRLFSPEKKTSLTVKVLKADKIQ